MHHPAARIEHTMAFVTLVVEHWLEQEIAQYVYVEGSIWHTMAFVTLVVEHWLEQEIAQYVWQPTGH